MRCSKRCGLYESTSGWEESSRISSIEPVRPKVVIMIGCAAARSVVVSGARSAATEPIGARRAALEHRPHVDLVAGRQSEHALQRIEADRVAARLRESAPPPAAGRASSGTLPQDRALVHALHGRSRARPGRPPSPARRASSRRARRPPRACRSRRPRGRREQAVWVTSRTWFASWQGTARRRPACER